MKRACKPTIALHVIVLVLFAILNAIPALGGEISLERAVNAAIDAGVPEATLNGLLLLGYEKRIDPAAMVNFVNALAEAQKEKIPLQLFVSKVKEGITKKVPPARIEQVLSRKMDDYRVVRAAVNDFMQKYGQHVSIPDEYLIRLTETLYCGLSREDVGRVMEQAPPTSVPVLTRGVEVLASLRQIKFDPSLSDQIVYSGIKQNYFTSERGDLVRVVAIAKEKGFSDAQITVAALGHMNTQGAMSDLSAQLGVTAEDIGRHGPQIGGGAGGAAGTGTATAASSSGIGGQGHGIGASGTSSSHGGIGSASSGHGGMGSTGGGSGNHGGAGGSGGGGSGGGGSGGGGGGSGGGGCR